MLKKLLLAPINLVCALICLIYCKFKLILHFNDFRRKKVIVLMRNGGFGQTVTAPDAVRRIYPNHQCVCVILAEPFRHNFKLPEIWPDIKLIMLPVGIGLSKRFIFGVRPLGSFLNRWFEAAIRTVILALMCGRGASFQEMGDIIKNISVNQSTEEVIKKLPLTASSAKDVNVYGSMIRYFRLSKSRPAPRLRVADSDRANIREKILKMRRYSNAAARPKLCMLYLRDKAAGSPDITSSRRDGAAIDVYAPAIELLNHLNYQVILVGDRPIPRKFEAQFSGGLVDASMVSVDRELFYLFAATEADIFVGESGGGIWLPAINQIPGLCVNAFPYFFGLPNCEMFYKTVRDSSGNLVDCQTLFSSHAYDYDFLGMKVSDNTALEIRSAVSCFLDTIEGRSARSDWEMKVWNDVPEFTWVKQAGARISPAWLELYKK